MQVQPATIQYRLCAKYQLILQWHNIIIVRILPNPGVPLTHSLAQLPYTSNGLNTDLILMKVVDLNTETYLFIIRTKIVNSWDFSGWL